MLKKTQQLIVMITYTFVFSFGVAGVMLAVPDIAAHILRCVFSLFIFIFTLFHFIFLLYLFYSILSL